MTSASWVPVPEGSPFTPHTLPYGVFAPEDGAPRVGVAIGDHVLDLARALGDDDTFARPSLNTFLAQGRARWQEVRARVTELLTDSAHRAAVEPALHRADRVRLLMPFEPADYVDFYASEHHAANIGRMLRPGQEPLTPQWKHLPIGYHGRSGTLVVSGTDVVRPWGQTRPADGGAPPFGPSARLDIEAEVGFVVGAPSARGTRVGVGDFADHVFGVCLVNDWSARDLQAWEYVPLGPFLAKSFATSVSPWIVPLDALEAARTAPPERTEELRPYLRDGEDWGLDLALEVRLNGEVVSRPSFTSMYWTPAQMLAHLTVNGASLRTGDFYASGTVSGPDAHERGCLMELTWNGQEPVTLSDGSTRTFLQDGDEVVISATAPGPDGSRIGFGEVRGRIVAGGDGS
ncbi:fumarylacetoacetase [Streptomyces olivaceus]|uniref:fumarylacetoacetase n=1 Tax=Streptomyces TaxID=1883 RepID=UPI0018A869AC|nr:MULTISPECIES: fumarylacetoacetase [Streptomyces]MBF8172318.1 fumarylacetoacetase [Streptomyces olivaceus]MBZ6134573.1 fumarylacetoacetase [Streptomyces olivaceus]MBZ6252982.1 fumarylacetoacetase [Streptomyces olivaceus]MBZ6260093.1 fumarylacetoacetase [Streptomyces olivaceus]MCU8591364.1 fumarylacetoacetase [Streptomyces sp. A13(2022)]